MYVCLRCGGIVPCFATHFAVCSLSLSLTHCPFHSRTRARTLYNMHYTVYRTRRIYTAPAAVVTFVPTRNVWCTPTCLRFQLHGLFPAAPLPTDRPRRRRLRSPYIIFYCILWRFRVIIYRHRTEINASQKP